MYPNAGDVQAPSPAPGSGFAETAKRHHTRKTSSRGFAELPPGSYGLHGHGVLSSDKLEQDYYHKHPDMVKKEHQLYQSDRPTNFSMSSVADWKFVEVDGDAVETADFSQKLPSGSNWHPASWAALPSRIQSRMT